MDEQSTVTESSPETSSAPEVAPPPRSDRVDPPREATSLRDVLGRAYDLAEKRAKSEEKQFHGEGLPEPGAASTADEQVKELDPPDAWSSEEDKQLFRSLPRAHQEKLVRHASEATEVAKKLEREKRLADEVREAWKPYTAKWKQAGVNPVALMKGLLADADWFERDPVAAVNEFLRRKGVSPSGQQPNGNQRNQQQQALPPQLAQELGTLKQRIQAQDAELQQLRQAREAHEKQVFQGRISEVSKFVSATNNGAPVRPELALKDGQFVHQDFGIRWIAQIKTERALNPSASAEEVMSKAYTVALRALPDFDARQKAEAEKANAANAAKARAAIRSNGSAPRASSKQVGLREMLSAAYDDSVSGAGRV